MPSGRPPADFDQKVADYICDELADGKSLVRILREQKRKNLPKSRTIVYRWLKDNPEFMNRYASAREMQADSLADDRNMRRQATSQLVTLRNARTNTPKIHQVSACIYESTAN